MATPKTLLDALDLVTTPEVAAPEMLAPLTATHYERVRTVFEDENIVGAGVARKISAERRSDTLGLVFYVREKKPVDAIRSDAVIPPVMAAANGRAIFTDVVEIGDLEPQLNIQPTPLKSGFSIGHKNISAGTLGAIVRKGQKQYLLSNSHVLADSGLGAIGDDVCYPGPMDVAAGLPLTPVATLESFTPFAVGPTFGNVADAALAEILVDQIADLDILHAISPRKIATPQRDMVVVKRGRTTGDTESVIRDVDFRILVGYPGVGTVGFNGQVLCDTYTKGGDSGSIVVVKETGAIVGLHFAGNSRGSVFTPIKTVMEALKFKF